ncbi:hypothetical protein IQ06DRAFT_149760 [Phaeosphaeriaceae sp. SRC1lsM3a]|nr:hypothetical protein IQ06DRAFT_149760 [Stagonospora sp. SRC1lsM3a]
MPKSALGFVAVIVSSIARVRGDCYARDGVAARESRYYNGAELVSCGKGSNTCCLPGQKCGSNLLCSAGPKLTREYCDNKEWQGCSKLGSEVLPYGITLNECGTNLVCYNNTACCTNGDPIYYIDPTTGDVQDAKQANVNTAPPTWWDPTSTNSASPVASPYASNNAVSSFITQSTFSRASSSPTSSSTSDMRTAASSSGLSTGARAGIGIGCAATAIGLGVMAWFLLRRRSRRAPKQISNEGYMGNGYQETKAGPQSTTHQLHSDAPQRQELDPQPRKIQEMP